MRALARLVRSKLLLSIIGLCLIALIVWHLGPMFAFAKHEPLASEDNRFITIAVVFGLWAAVRLFKYFRARSVSSRVIEAILGKSREMRADKAVQPSAEEVAILEQNLQKAVGVLKASKDNRWSGRQFIYQLPWYVLIGPPGSGKTTALTSSGLRFLVTDEHGQGCEMRGVHGTRDCDWFFTDEAVLLDTAGRYVTQDSRKEVDEGAWLGFLNLLKTYRKRRPINGVIVCVSLPDLVAQSESHGQRESQAIRLRIRELHEQLGISFPIYLMFTKCDLISGFSEFFDDLAKEDREQIWGMTFPIDNDPSTLSESFNREFKLLEQRLNERLVNRLEQERDQRRRDSVYGFPKQFASVQMTADRFIKDTFEVTRYEQPATLRGIYFASGTQVGTPLDRLTAALTSSFGLPRENLPSFSGLGKSYFVNRLLNDVVFQESGLANTDAREEKRRRWLQNGAFLGGLLLCIIVASAWLKSYVDNKTLIKNVLVEADATKTLVNNVPSNERDLHSTLPALNAARKLTGRDRDGDTVVSAVMQLGLDQRPVLEGEAHETYRNLLQDLFLPRLILRLEERLKSAEQTDEIYSALRTYLMLRTPEHFASEQIAAWLDQDLQAHDIEVVDKGQRESLIRHLNVLFEYGPVDLPLNLDANIVQGARGQLLGMSFADRVYRQIIENGSVWSNFSDFHAVERVGNVFKYIFATGQNEQESSSVDRRFTISGYQAFKEQIRVVIERQAGEDWIVGEGFGASAERDFEQVRVQVLQRYLTEYQSRWNGFLDSLSIVAVDNDINKLIDVLQIVSADDSPLKNLLVAVELETTLQRGDNLVEKSTQATESAGEVIKSFTKKLIGGGVPRIPALGDKELRSRYPVDAHFAPLNKLVRADEGSAPAINNTLAILTELSGYLKAAQNAHGIELINQVKSLSSGVVGRLQQETARQPKPLRKWLEVIEWQVRQALGAKALAALNAEWRSTALRDFNRGLKGKYPIARSSKQDATIEDFGEFFGPEGTLDKFFQAYLADIIDTSGRVWRLSASSPIHLSREALIALQRGAAIREAFFGSSATTPVVKFSMKPIAMDVGINDFALDLDGQTMKFDHSATRAKALQWPGPRGTGTINLRASPPVSQGTSSKTVEGYWAWFRLLDNSVINSRSANHFDITFDIDGRKIEYEIRADSSTNPFRQSELERFRCPEIL